MTPFIDLAVRVAAIMLVALAVRWLLRGRSAAARHAALTAGLTAAITVPFIAMLLPAWHVDLQPARRIQATPSSVGKPPLVAEVTETAAPRPVRPAAAPVPEPLLTRDQAVAVVWSIGTLAGLVGLLGGLLRLRIVSARATPAAGDAWARRLAQCSAALHLTKPITLLISDSSKLMATWGAIRPRIVLPAEAATWPEDRVRVVLCHELAHVRRGDWFVQMLAETLRALFWFNPLSWVLCARLRHDSEQACDDVVMAAGVPADAYAGHLLDIARASRRADTWVPAMPVARSSTLERRIVAMLKPDLDRRPITARRLALVVAALIVIATPIGVLRGAQQAGPATLSGVAYDSTGAALPQVTLVLIDSQQVARSTTTDAGGRFAFDGIPAGTFVMQSTLMGFRPLRQEITLASAADWSQAVTMQVGTLEETITVTERRPSSVQTPTLPASNRIGGNIKAPRKVVDVKPIYPPAMRDAGLEGTVAIEARIGTDGTVISAEVASARVHPEFAAAAVEAVKQWRFTPTLLNGVPIEVQMIVKTQFRLED